MTSKERRANFVESMRRVRAVFRGEAAELRFDSQGRLWIASGGAEAREYQAAAHVDDVDVVREVQAFEQQVPRKRGRGRKKTDQGVSQYQGDF